MSCKKIYAVNYIILWFISFFSCLGLFHFWPTKNRAEPPSMSYMTTGAMLRSLASLKSPTNKGQFCAGNSGGLDLFGLGASKFKHRNISSWKALHCEVLFLSETSSQSLASIRSSLFLILVSNFVTALYLYLFSCEVRILFPYTPWISNLIQLCKLLPFYCCIIGGW